jgi:transposase-like protein
MEEKAFEKRETQVMEEKQVAQAGSFCWNEAGPAYGQGGKGNIIKNGKTDKGVQRYRCQTCQQTFTATKGTLFYRCRHSEEEIVECMAMLGDRNRLAAIHRMKGIKEETIARWMERAATQVERIEEQLLGPKKLNRVQMEALWKSVGHKGEKGASQKKKHEGRFGEEAL